MNTLIIYDWDDTLFPTSYIQHNQEYKKSDFFILEQQNIRLLEKSRQHAQVLIITNANTQWIYNSSKKYMYRLYQYLNYTQIPIISAREYATSKHITNYERWKDITFYDSINRYMNISMINNKYINNIISIGDATFERNALVKYGYYITNKVGYTIYIKTIKYIDNPRPDNLIYQTISLINNLEYHIRVNKNLNIDM